MTPARLSEFTAARTVAETAAQSVIKNAASEETALVAKALLDAYAMVDEATAEIARLRDALVTLRASLLRMPPRISMMVVGVDEALKGGA